MDELLKLRDGFVVGDAAEAFLPSSTRDLQPIRAADGTPLAVAPGPLTERAMAVWAERAAADPDP